jgi:hypothetical protein
MEMLIIICVIILFCIFNAKTKVAHGVSNMPMCSRSEGIEGHYAFLEMHGFDSGRPKELTVCGVTKEHWTAMDLKEVFEKNGLLKSKDQGR